MINIRRSDERGHAQHGWLDSYHTFSFASYYDPNHMGFRSLRVINDDRIAPSAGFPTHPHHDMEIITYILKGTLTHQDSTGNTSVIRPGDVQRMSAGTGITHSEFNASSEESVHLLQIWIEPEVAGMRPSYEQRHFSRESKQGRLLLVASPDGADGSVTINQDAKLYAGVLQAGDTATLSLTPGRSAYMHVADGPVALNGQSMGTGDGAAITQETALSLQAQGPAEVLLFELA